MVVIIAVKIKYIKMNPKQFIHPRGKLIRCPGCGGMVQMPCMSCYYANNRTYPVEVIEATRHKRPSGRRKCIVCGKVKVSKYFRQGDNTTVDSRMYNHICYNCKRIRNQEKESENE